MDKIYGRSDDMLIIGGVNVFPSQVESILLDVKEVEPQYVLVVRKKGASAPFFFALPRLLHCLRERACAFWLPRTTRYSPTA